MTEELPSREAIKKLFEDKARIDEQLTELSGEPGKGLDAGMGVYRGNMELAEEFQKVSPIYYDTSKNFWLWIPKEGYYKRIDEVDILSAIRKRCDEKVIESKISSEIIRGLQITGRERDIKTVPITWIHTYSGIVDYITGERIKPTPDYFLTCPIPHKIGTCDDVPTISKLFKDWVGDQDSLLYEWLAYLLINDYPMHRMLILFGSGRNGKGQYADLLTRFVGLENMAATDLEKLIENRFETSKLHRKKLAVVDETDFNAIKNTARVKAISGGSRIGGEYKGKDGFDFYNTAKVTILTNNLPESLDKTEAFYGRCMIQEFKNKFDEGKSVTALIPEVEYECLLYKCIKMLPDLMKKGKFTNEGTIEDKAKKYERISNPWESFFSKELVEDENAKTPIWIIYDLYTDFCKINNFRIPSKTEVTQKLKREGYTAIKARFGEKTWAAVLGLRNKDPYVYEDRAEEKRDPDVPHVPHVPLPQVKRVYEKLNEHGGTCGTTGTEHNNCGICEQPLNGNSEQGPAGLGKIHPSCKYSPVRIKALVDLPVFVAIDQHTYTLTKGEVKALPWMNAQALINRRAAEKVI